jgi:hypothetical protein
MTRQVLRLPANLGPQKAFRIRKAAKIGCRIRTRGREARHMDGKMPRVMFGARVGKVVGRMVALIGMCKPLEVDIETLGRADNR